MFVEQIAKYLTAQNIVDYDPDSTDTDTFIVHVPSEGDDVIILTPFPGDEPDSKLGYDAPRFQVRARAGADPTVASDRIAEIYAALNGLGKTTLDDGTVLISCQAMQSGPGYIGQDGNGRHEFTCDFEAEVRAVTTHRE